MLVEFHSRPIIRMQWRWLTFGNSCWYRWWRTPRDDRWTERRRFIGNRPSLAFVGVSDLESSDGPNGRGWTFQDARGRWTGNLDERISLESWKTTVCNSDRSLVLFASFLQVSLNYHRPFVSQETLIIQLISFSLALPPRDRDWILFFTLCQQVELLTESELRDRSASWHLIPVLFFGLFEVNFDRIGKR